MHPPRRRARGAVIALVAALALVACGDDSASTPSPPQTAAVETNARVERIVDGDTIVADFGGRTDRVRLIGIDTPESAIPDTAPECFGIEATRHLEALIPAGTPILVERDVEARDRFDRLLGYVYRSSDGLFVNLAMAADGYALTLTIPPNVTHADAFADAVASARRDGLGLWGAC